MSLTTFEETTTTNSSNSQDTEDINTQFQDIGVCNIEACIVY